MSRRRKPLMSYSAADKWLTCGELYYLKYVKRIRTREEGASLAFGIAIDTAVSYLLQCKKDGLEHIGLASYKDKFLTDADKGWNNVLDCSKYKYRKADYDPVVVRSVDDTTLLKKWEEELGVKASDAISAEKTQKYKPFKGKKLQMFSRMCWLSLKRKGLLMLEAFEKEIYPNILEVIAVQHKFTGNVGDVADTSGYIDLICMYKGYDKPVILDLKTSSSFYEEHSVQFSDQLHIYLSAVGKDLDTDLAGYIILLKFMQRDDVCSKCGYKKDGRHRTCNNMVDGERCGGKWDKVPKGHTQVIINPVTQEKQDDSLQSFTNVTLLASQGLRYKRKEACFKYGMCDMFHLCHYGDRTKYIFPEEDEKNESTGKTK
jgi:hypothetical protein